MEPSAILDPPQYGFNTVSSVNSITRLTGTAVATIRTRAGGVSELFYVRADHLGTPRAITSPVGYGSTAWWWFFLIQPTPFPESMIAGAPEIYLQKKIGRGHAGMSAFTPETYAAYLSYVSDPATMHAMCEDYRATASVDLEHDRADRAAGKKIACPVNVLWGEHGVVNRCFKPIEDWQRVASDVRGRTLPCGHYIPEEVPAALLQEMLRFFC